MVSSGFTGSVLASGVGTRPHTSAVPPPCRAFPRGGSSLRTRWTSAREAQRYPRGVITCQAKRGKKWSPQKAEPSGTGLEAATFRGIEEDHRFEQFFYDDATTDRIFRLVKSFERPLLLCNPTLAVLAEEANMDYLLLDKDTRFKKLLGKVSAHHFASDDLARIVPPSSSEVSW